MNNKLNAIDYVIYSLLAIMVIGIFGAIIYVSGQKREEISKARSENVAVTDVVDTTAVHKKKIVKFTKLDRADRQMQLYDVNGNRITYCNAYKGSFDGHTWYVFFGDMASPSVVHDPSCECGGK